MSGLRLQISVFSVWIAAQDRGGYAPGRPNDWIVCSVESVHYRILMYFTSSILSVAEKAKSEVTVIRLAAHFLIVLYKIALFKKLAGMLKQ